MGAYLKFRRKLLEWSLIHEGEARGDIRVDILLRHEEPTMVYEVVIDCPGYERSAWVTGDPDEAMIVRDCLVEIVQKHPDWPG